MRISKLKLFNYRQFRESEINFHNEDTGDLNILIGENGTGKTNILNAINWCLYDEEPHLAKESDQLPIVNLETIARSEEGQKIEVIVEVHTESNGMSYRFRRKASYTAYRNDIIHQQTIFKLHDIGGVNGTKTYTGEDAKNYLNKIFPKRIREFFFFDGERLDKYFRESTAQNVRHAVFRLSKLNLLENELERKLDNLISTLEEKAGKLNPEIENIHQKREKEKESLAEIEKMISNAKEQADIAKNKIKDYDEKLAGLPDVEELDNERKKLEETREKKEEICEEKTFEKNRRLVICSKAVYLFPAIERAIQVIEEKEANNEIPPTVDLDLLQQILDDNLCKICGQVLDKNGSQRVQEMVNKIGLSSAVSHQLSFMKAPLIQLKNDANKLKEYIQKTTREIKSYQTDIDDLTQKIVDIKNKLSTYDKKEIRNWHREREKLGKSYDRLQQDIGVNQEEMIRVKKELAQSEKEFYKEVEKEDKAKNIKLQSDFCKKALEIVQKTRKDIMKTTRQEIEKETENIFFALTWKHDTFKEVKIKPNYDISLIHSMDYDCLGSLSAGERELLAISFFLAIHRISEFRPPILIDTPVARISGKHRVNFGKTLAKVSHRKQVVLLFTPSEYSKEIAKTMDQEASNRYLLNLSSDEKISIVEEL